MSKQFGMPLRDLLRRGQILVADTAVEIPSDDVVIVILRGLFGVLRHGAGAEPCAGGRRGYRSRSSERETSCPGGVPACTAYRRPEVEGHFVCVDHRERSMSADVLIGVTSNGNQQISARTDALSSEDAGTATASGAAGQECVLAGQRCSASEAPIFTL